VIGYELATQPPGLRIRAVEAGYLARSCAGRMGRGTKFPPQFGHWWFKTWAAQEMQKVHSKVQITASVDSGGKSLSQHSQLGLSSSIALSVLIHNSD
jgi:hypothetical protein